MWGRIRNQGRTRNHRWRWKMRRGRWGWCAFTRRSGILIRTRLVCLGFRQAVIWWQRRARILRSACIRLSNAADKERCRPDFAVAIYPGHLSLSAARWDAKQGTKKLVIRYPATADKDLGLNPDIP